MTPAKVTVRIPQELRELMDRHPDVNWSAVFREAVVRHARALDAAKGIAEEEADPRIAALAERLKKGAAARYRKATRAAGR